MSISAKRTALAFSFLTLSTLTVSSLATAGDPGPDDTPPEGVPVDLSNIVIDQQSINRPSSTAAPAGVTDGTGNPVNVLQTTASAAGTTGGEKIGAVVDKGKEFAGNVMEALTPADTVAPLNNDRVEVYATDDVVFAMYERSGTAIERFKLEETRAHLGFLYSEGRDTVFQGGLSIDSPLTRFVRLSFGSRAYIGLLGEENEDTFAAAIGAEAAYQLPFERLPLEFAASLYFAPDILTFGSSDRVIDTRFGIALPVRSQLSIFGGARFLQFDTRPGDEEVDNQVHLGARWDFKNSESK